MGRGREARGKERRKEGNKKDPQEPKGTSLKRLESGTILPPHNTNDKKYLGA